MKSFAYLELVPTATMADRRVQTRHFQCCRLLHVFAFLKKRMKPWQSGGQRKEIGGVGVANRGLLLLLYSHIPGHYLCYLSRLYSANIPSDLIILLTVPLADSCYTQHRPVHSTRQSYPFPRVFAETASLRPLRPQCPTAAQVPRRRRAKAHH